MFHQNSLKLHNAADDMNVSTVSATSGLQTVFAFSASMSNMAKIEEMECLLREAQAEKQRLLEHRVRFPPKHFALITFFRIAIYIILAHNGDVAKQNAFCFF